MKPILTVLFLILSSTVFGQWTEILKQTSGTSYYNATRTNRDGTTVTTWMKTVYQGTFLETYRQRLNDAFKGTENPKDFSNLGWMIQKITIDCKTLRYQSRTTTYYNEDGTVIYSMDSDPDKWNESPPDSVAENIYGTVCTLTK